MATPANIDPLASPFVIIENVLSNGSDIDTSKLDSNAAMGTIRQVYSGYTAFAVGDVIFYKKANEISFSQGGTRFFVIPSTDIVFKSTYFPL